MKNMRKLAAALVLGMVLCLAIFSTGASADNGNGLGFFGSHQRVRANAVAVARGNNFFHRFGNFDGFGGLGGFGFFPFFGGFGDGFFGNNRFFDNNDFGGAFARANVRVHNSSHGAFLGHNDDGF